MHPSLKRHLGLRGGMLPSQEETKTVTEVSRAPFNFERLFTRDMPPDAIAGIKKCCLAA